MLPDGDATIVVCRKVVVVLLDSNNIWPRAGHRCSIAVGCHHLCGSTFSRILRGLRRQLLTGLERGWHRRWQQQRGNNPAGGYDEEEAQIQHAINLSRAESEFRHGVEGRGGTYEHGGGSGSAGLNPLQRMVRRAGSRRDTPVVVEDYNLAAGGRRGMTQPRIDTGS
jgi:hypothetical protein